MVLQRGRFAVGRVFTKDIDSFPQTILCRCAAVDLRRCRRYRADPARLHESQIQLAYIDSDGTFRARQFRDAPGGELSGYELSYQQDFTFLPGFLKNFGAQINYTNI